MLIKTRGIVLKVIKYGETSVIADVFTENKGLQTYIANGVRTTKAKIHSNLLQPMSIIDIVAYYHEDREIERIKEIKANYVYQKLPFELQRGAVGLFMIELAQKTVKEKEENKILFNYLYSVFILLDSTKFSFANIHLSYMVHLASFLGFQPSGKENDAQKYFDLEAGIFVEQCPSHPYYIKEALSMLLNQLLVLDLHKSHEIKMNKTMRNELIENLLLFYKLHIEHFSHLNSYQILKEI